MLLLNDYALPMAINTLSTRACHAIMICRFYRPPTGGAAIKYAQEIGRRLLQISGDKVMHLSRLATSGHESRLCASHVACCATFVRYLLPVASECFLAIYRCLPLPQMTLNTGAIA